jgi:membrane protease YdiL (CAAX protease family)
MTPNGSTEYNVNVTFLKIKSLTRPIKFFLTKAIMIKPYPTYSQAIVLILIWFLATILCVVVIIIPFFKITDGLGLSIAYSVSMTLTAIAGFVIRQNWKLPINTFPFPIIAFSIVIVLGAQLILDPLKDLFPVPDMLINMVQGVKEQPYTYFFMIVIAAPILEEILFRGIILDGFLKNYTPLNAILVSAFMFGLIHGNIPQGIGAFMLGSLFGWIYWKTNSILPCMILHAINNGLAFFMILNTSEADLDKSFPELINNDLLYYTLYVLSMGIVAAAIWHLQKNYFSKISVKEIEIIPEQNEVA